MVSEELRIRHILRQMEWQKAKGSLYAILETFWGEQETFDKCKDLFEKFIEEVEGLW